MFNKGLHNKTEFKAVPCNLVKKIFKIRDEILSDCDDYTLEDYNDMYKSYFESIDTNANSLGMCFSFILNYSYDLVKTDVQIYTCEYGLNNKGKYQGVCKLHNGAEIIVFNVAGEESGYNMLQVVYFDGEFLRTFTPFEGNFVNVLTMTCLGDEVYCKLDEFDNDLYKEVLGDKVVSIKDDDFEEQMYEGYCRFQGFDCDYNSSLNIDFDYDAMCKEIESALI